MIGGFKDKEVSEEYTEIIKNNTAVINEKLGINN